MKGFFSASGSALALVLLAQQASAQQASAQEPATIDDVIVTARKTDERLIDVPVAASVLGSEQLENLVLDKIEDYLRQSPSTVLVSGGPEYLSDISIRGQGGGRLGFSESATGVYRNGIYAAGGGFGGRSYNVLDLHDISRFEVYRGPQGALYGRNAVGGAINVVTRRPDPTAYSGSIGVGWDERDRVNYNGVLNLPLVADVVAARFGLTGYDQAGGYITDVATGDIIDTQSFNGGRLAVSAQLAPAWLATVTLEASESTAPGFSVLGRRLDVAGRAERFDPSQFERNASRRGEVRIDESAAYAEIDGDLGIGDLTFVAAWKQRDGGRFNEDLDHFLGFEDVPGPAPARTLSDLAVTQTEDYERSGAEIRLASKPDMENLRWLIGADYQTSDSDVLTTQSGVTTIPNLGEISTRTEAFIEGLTSYSAFGLVELTLSPRLTISGEARQQYDDKDFVYLRTDRNPVPVNSSLGPVALDRSWSAFLPTATIRYRISDDGIIYLRAASGYRPGGFNTGTSNVDALSYDPERSTTLEVGLKGKIFGTTTYGLTAYYNQTDDLQVTTTVSSTDTTPALENVSGAWVAGLEIEVSREWGIGPGTLSAQAFASFGDGEFDEGASSLVQGVRYDVSGTRLNRVRDYSAALNFRYRWPVFGGAMAFVALSAQAEGGGYENTIGALRVPGQSRSLDDFSNVDLRVGLNTPRWSASIFVQNIGDDSELLQNVLGNEFYGNPRTIGAELTMRFRE